MTPVSLEKSWDKTQTADWNIFSRLYTRGGKVAQTRDQVSIPAEVCPGLGASGEG